MPQGAEGALTRAGARASPSPNAAPASRKAAGRALAARSSAITGAVRDSKRTFSPRLATAPDLCTTCGLANVPLGPPAQTCATVSGSTATGCESHFYTVELVAGESYTFTLCGAECGGANANYDSRLRVYDPSCQVLADNDDYCGVASQLTIAATTTGTHRVEVTGYTSGSVGDYVLGYHQICNEQGDCATPNGIFGDPTTQCQNAPGSLTCGRSRAYRMTLSGGRHYTFTTNAEVCAGASVSFPGSIELYRWYGYSTPAPPGGLANNGTALAIATEGADLVFDTDPASGAGEYCVRIVSPPDAIPATFDLAWNVACQSPTQVTAGPTLGGATTAQCTKNETFTATSDGTGAFTFNWQITAPQGATATPATRTITHAEATDSFTPTLTGAGEYQVLVTVTNDCGSTEQSFVYTLGDNDLPRIQCSATEVPCLLPQAPVAPGFRASPSARRMREASAASPTTQNPSLSIAPPRATTKRPDARARLDAQRVRAALADDSVRRTLLGATSKEAARMAIARRLALPLDRVGVQEQRAYSPRALIASSGLDCANPCQPGNTLHVEHPYYALWTDCGNGSFWANTGAQHSLTLDNGPQPVLAYNRNTELYPSSVMIEDHDAGSSYSMPYAGGACVFRPPGSPTERAGQGIAAEWDFVGEMGAPLTVRQEIVAFGERESEAGIRLTVAITNHSLSNADATLGLRWSLDHQNAGDRGPLLAPVGCAPFTTGTELSTEHELAPSEIGDFYRMQNNTDSPVYGVYVNTSPIVGFPGTAAPERLVYGVWDWGNLGDAPFDYTAMEGADADYDSATLYYFGARPETGLYVGPGERVERSLIIFAAADATSCGAFPPRSTLDAKATACNLGCVRVGATATDACSAPTIRVVSSPANGPACDGSDCVLTFTTPGDYVYEFEATDAAGNTSRCTSTVTIADVTAADCDDGDACNGLETCGGGQCVPGTPVVCDAPGVCHVAAGATCDPVDGACHYPNALDGTACDDADLCNGHETCLAGVCSPGAPPACDDGLACTTDACDPATGCVSTVNAGFCLIDSGAGASTDGGASAPTATCVAAGAPNPSNPCEICDPSRDPYGYSPTIDGRTCSDGNPCNGLETCVDGACEPGTPIVCDAPSICHTATGATCDPATGACSYPNVANGTACSDGDACRGQKTCQAGVCQGGAPVLCDAPPPCHTATGATCNPTNGVCTYPAAADGTSCSDGNPCNGVEVCRAGSCVAGTPIACNAPPPCRTTTGAACDPETGACNYPIAPNGTACSDGNACNGLETCQMGACVAGEPVVCNAPPSCRTASGATCDPATGACVYPAVPNGISCSDGNPCNGEETCLAGACVAHTPPSCDDGNPCTADRCEPARGCVHEPIADGTECRSGNACHRLETCQSGECSPGEVVACDAPPACRTTAGATCNPRTGACRYPALADGTSCGDGNACNGDETCRAGECVAGAPPTCDDGNPCTADACDPARGCTHTPVADGTPCTPKGSCGVSSCRAGTCAPSASDGCDDGNACTVDTCDSAQGCVHTPKSCDDGNACTVDTCDSARGCVHTPKSCDDGNACTADSCDPVLGCANVCLPNRTGCGQGGVCVDCQCVVTEATGSTACGAVDGNAAGPWALAAILAFAALLRRRRRPRAPEVRA